MVVFHIASDQILHPSGFSLIFPTDRMIGATRVGLPPMLSRGVKVLSRPACVASSIQQSPKFFSTCAARDFAPRLMAPQLPAAAMQRRWLSVSTNRARLKYTRPFVFMAPCAAPAVQTREIRLLCVHHRKSACTHPLVAEIYAWKFSPPALPQSSTRPHRNGH